MPKESIKLICPQCFQIVRSTYSNHCVVCGYCMKRMVPAPRRDKTDRNFDVSFGELFPTDSDREI